MLSFFIAIFNTWLAIWLYSLLISLSGDIQLNPEPKRNTNATFSTCHWNLNGISSQRYTKVSILKAYVVVHKFYLICLSKTYLDSNTASDDDNFEIPGYTLIGSDHPLIIKM